MKPSIILPAPHCRAGHSQPTCDSRRPARFCSRHFVLLSALALASCTALPPLKGGRAVTRHGPAGAIQQSLVQGDNPDQPTRQDQETVRVRSYTLPAGARIEDARVQTLEAGVPVTNFQSIVLSTPMPVTEREESRAKTELGAAQKDTACELGARLSSLRPITWVGAALFVFGLAALGWPPLKAIIGSVTTSAAILAGGLALVILPTLVVGNELLILGGVALTAGAWFLAHRHGQLRGLLDATAPRSDATPAADSLARNAAILRQTPKPGGQ